MKGLSRLLIIGAWAPNLVFSAIVNGRLSITEGNASAIVPSVAADDSVSTVERTGEWKPNELVLIANNGSFKMIKDNMNKIPDWVQKYKDWEALALQDTASAKSLSARYGEEKLGMPHWFCDPDNGCSSLPSPLKILQFVDATEPEMPRDKRLEEAQGRYWAAMSYYMTFRTASHTLNALKRAQDFVLPRIDTIIVDFTKQGNSKAILQCKIKTFFIDMTYQFTEKFLMLSLTKATGFEGKWGNVATKFEKAEPFYILSMVRQIIDFTLPMEHDYKYKKFGAGNDGDDSLEFLRLTSMTYTSDLYCGHIDGQAADGSDTMTRISDSKYHISEIMKQYIKDISGVFRALNGHGEVDLDLKMSDWMLNANYDEMVHRLDRVDISAEAQKFSQTISGYLISAGWASNKCYMKCQPKMFRDTVQTRCFDAKFAADRFCPEDAPDTLCQVNCYTMLDSGNHEKKLIGIEKLPKHGFDIENIKRDSWENYKELKRLRKPQMDYVNGKEFTFGAENRSALILSVSLSRTNIISDKPTKSLNFPCFSGQDYRGLDTEQHLINMNMGFGSTDWGGGGKGKARVWEMFQQHCPEQTREMPPLTRYLNMVCGQRLKWPDKSLRDGLVHRRVMQPDLEGKNFETCRTLREKTEDMDEETANHLFCHGYWPESATIFANERSWVYTDWNHRWHRGSGLKFMWHHKFRCHLHRKGNQNFRPDQKWLEMNWSNDPSKVVGEGDNINGTVLELDSEDFKAMEDMPTDAEDIDPEATERLRHIIEEFSKEIIRTKSIQSS
ncbi:uncharacterized protein EAE98_002787 [Botrytis deweyae]|uniref:Uncharacterized protein n=1 Tax=Botrytis deweyae TaxID=2478750 RepID=A0ABQ7IUQ5_9HELO|nr:uncharacterized protein EAE98_002787 [Botrytis deweyae]KAF7934742.1 hypothetical protein EAE98_002787 [Botrytis deweyae]